MASAALTPRCSREQDPDRGSVAVWVGGRRYDLIGARRGRRSGGVLHGSYVEISQQHMLVTDGYDWVRIVPNATGNQWELWPTSSSTSRLVRDPATDMSVARASILVHVDQRDGGARNRVPLSRTRR